MLNYTCLFIVLDFKFANLFIFPKTGIFIIIIINNYSERALNSPTRRVARVGYNDLISNKHEWNNSFIKNAPKISDISSRLYFVR